MNPNRLWKCNWQILEWVYGLTNIQFELASTEIARVSQGDDVWHYSFRFATNTARLVGLVHPMGLFIESFSLEMTGVLDPERACLHFSEVADEETPVVETDHERSPNLHVKADNGGFSVIAVAGRVTRFDGGEEMLSRHFIFRNNFLHKIR